MTNTLFDLVDVGQRVEALEAGFSGGGGGGGGGGSGYGFSWELINTNTTAQAYKSYLCDTSSGAFTLTLPASPAVGDTVTIADASDFRVNSLTVARNGNTIENYSDDVVIDVQNVMVYFVYDGSNWQVSATTGPEGNQGLSGYSGLLGPQGFSGYSGINSGGEIYQTVKSENYTTTYNDIGKHIFHPGTDSVTPRTFTIAANSSVAYPIGTTLTFVNHFNASTVFITIGGTDTLRLAGVSGSGSTTVPRILSPNGMATALKINTTEWILNGVNIV